MKIELNVEIRDHEYIQAQSLCHKIAQIGCLLTSINSEIPALQLTSCIVV
jgi:hypothetical protein